MIVVDPGETPVTVPLLLSMVAAVVLLLLHVPPVVASDSVMAEPAQTVDRPAIADGNAFAVTDAVAVLVQPFASVPVTV